MGYVNGNLVKSTGATPVFKVDVCSDNSPHCWEGLPIVVKKPVSHKGVVRPWLSLGAVRHHDLGVNNQVTSGPYWKLGTEVTSYKSVDNSLVSSGWAIVFEQFGVKCGVSLGTNWKPRVEIVLAKRCEEEEDD